MKHIPQTIKLIGSLLIAGGLFVTGSAHAATTPAYVSGVPIATFCATYTKNVQTKSVAISIALKIKAQPSKKASLMRQYQTFVVLGKQYCKSTTPAPVVVPTPPKVITGTYFTGFDSSLLVGLTNDDRAIISGRIEKGKQSFTEIVDTLISKGRLTPSDKKEMEGKITFKFSENCNQLDGKILVKQRYNSNKELIKSELINLFITINVCFSPYYQAHYTDYLEKIIYHELGHYYSYFHDTTKIDFMAICRTNGTPAANICDSGDFISSYASTLPDEDYAETFSYYLLDNDPVSRPVLQEKIDYFKNKD